MALNKFMGIGNLCADVEIRQVGQSSVGKVNLAMSEKFRKQDGTVGESTEFLTLEIWDKQNVYPYLKKGVQVYVEGPIRTESWVDEQGGKHYSTKCRVMSVQLLGSRPQQESAPRPQAPQPQFSAPTYSSPQPSYQPQYGGAPQCPATRQEPVAPPKMADFSEDLPF